MCRLNHRRFGTLTGTVEDQDESNLAVDTVANLAGVVSVTHEIKADPTWPEKSDGGMALKVRGRRV